MIDKFVYASYAIGSPIIKYGKKGLRLIKKTTPKSVKKFGKKSTKFLGKEYQEMKHFAKTNPELFAGGATMGVGLGTGIGATINVMRNGKKKKKKRRT
tara:strand:- start:20 stop:313 length:294 start_codon:yes stop_codon:yes gene_type:complete